MTDLERAKPNFLLDFKLFESREEFYLISFTAQSSVF